MSLPHDEKSQFLELRFHSKTFLILLITQHIPFFSLSSLWPPEICSKGPSEVMGWILHTFTHKNDQCDSGDILGCTEALMHNSALNYPRPSRIRLVMLQNIVRNITDHSQHFPGYKFTWFCSLCIQSCTFHPGLLLGLLCTPSQVIQSLSEAWLLTQSWAETAGRASTVRVFAISVRIPRPGIRPGICLLPLAEPHTRSLAKVRGRTSLRAEKIEGTDHSHRTIAL